MKNRLYGQFFCYLLSRKRDRSFQNQHIKPKEHVKIACNFSEREKIDEMYADLISSLFQAKLVGCRSQT
jgi:hypothetical protein